EGRRASNNQIAAGLRPGACSAPAFGPQPLSSGFHLNAHGKMRVPESPHRRSAMNLRKCALLLIVAMLALTGAADAQRTKSKSKSQAKKPANTASASQAAQATPAAPAEHKTEGEIPRITVEELKEKLAKNAPVFII